MIATLLSLVAQAWQRVVIKLKSGEVVTGIAASCSDQWAEVKLPDGVNLVPLHNILSVVRVV